MKSSWIINRASMELVPDVLGSVSHPITWGSYEADIYHCLVPRPRMMELYFHSPIRLQGVILD
jgi:hypothetical protein